MVREKSEWGMEKCCLLVAISCKHNRKTRADGLSTVTPAGQERTPALEKYLGVGKEKRLLKGGTLVTAY